MCIDTHLLHYPFNIHSLYLCVNRYCLVADMRLHAVLALWVSYCVMASRNRVIIKGCMIYQVLSHTRYFRQIINGNPQNLQALLGRHVYFSLTIIIAYICQRAVGTNEEICGEIIFQ